MTDEEFYSDPDTQAYIKATCEGRFNDARAIARRRMVQDNTDPETFKQLLEATDLLERNFIFGQRWAQLGKQAGIS